MSSGKKHPLDGLKIPDILRHTHCPSLPSLMNSETILPLEEASSIVAVDLSASTSRRTKTGSQKRLAAEHLSPRKRNRKHVVDEISTEISSSSTSPLIQQLPSPVESHLAITSDPSSSFIFNNFANLSTASQSVLLLEFLKRSHVSTLQMLTSLVLPTLKRDFIAELPRELVHLILVKLDLRSLCLCALVSKKWKHIIDNDGILWRYFLTVEGWDERTMRDVFLLQKAKSSLVDEHIAAEAIRFQLNSGGRDMELLSPINIPSFDALREDPFILLPTLPKPRSNFFPLPHIFKLLFSHYYTLRNNWFMGRCKTLSFPAHDDRVITNLIIDSRYIITGSDTNVIYVLDIQTGEIKRRLEGHEGGVWCLEVCGPQRNTLVSGCTDRTVRVWDLERGKCLQVLRGHSSTIRCLSVIPIPVDPTSPQSVENGSSASGKSMWVITGARDSTIRVWQINMAQPLTENALDVSMDSEPHRSSTPLVHREEREFEVGSSAEDEEENLNDEESTNSEDPSFLFSLRGHEGSVRAMAAHGDIAVTASYDHTLRVWHLPSRQCIFRLTGHTNKIYSLVYDHKNNLVISGGIDATIRIWSTKTGECLRILDGHTGLVGLMQLDYLAYTPTGPRHKLCNLVKPEVQKSHTRRPYLMSAAADGVIKVWNPINGDLLHSFYGHRNAITCFQFDGDKLVSGGEGTVKIWDMRNGLFVRDMVANITGAWKLAINERYCVMAVQQANSETWFYVMDYAVQV